MAVQETGWFFPAPEESELPENLRKLFAKARENLGFVPNVFHSYAYRPERLSAWFAHYRQLHEPTESLSAADREMIAVVVSMVNGCVYCLVAHGTDLADALGDRVEADRITLDWRRAGLDEKRARICEYAEKLTARPRECDPADLEGLREVGLTDEEIWDVIEIAAMYNFTNRMAMATGHLPNREYHRADRSPGS
ncbi:MAG: peroxidase-related enzyme [Streptosporangiales bacterium]|nr:peroxidase-related enzyme [Streptosporangiales bacterium]